MQQSLYSLPKIVEHMPIRVNTVIVVAFQGRFPVRYKISLYNRCIEKIYNYNY